MDDIPKIAQRRRRQPTCVVRADNDQPLYAARWQLRSHRARSGCQTNHILTCQMEGRAIAAKITGERTLRKYAHPGVVALIPPGDDALYVLEGDAVVLDLYIPPAVLSEYGEQQIRGGVLPSIPPLFAEEDSWLAGYFKMLESEIQLHGGPTLELDSLLLGQTQQLLLTHLLRRYGEAALPPPYARGAPRRRALRPYLLKRVADFVHENLGREIRLKELAGLAHLSERHFIRAFSDTVGCTPHQYVLARRLAACAEILGRRDRRPIAQVARTMGFRSQSHFAAKFRERYGVTPSEYRARRV